MSQYSPIADLKVKVRDYKGDDGKTKGVWTSVGTLWSTPHGSSQFITLDSIPVNSFKDGERVPFDGRVSIFKRDNAEVKDANELTHDLNKKMTSKDVVLDDIDDKPIDLSEVPF